MNNPTTEDLKKIAEVMGYRQVEIVNCHVYCDYRYAISKNHFEYNPKTNPAQLLEIIEKYQPSIDWINKDLCQVTIYMVRPPKDCFRNEYEGRGKTLADAVLQAMIKVIGE